MSSTWMRAGLRRVGAGFAVIVFPGESQVRNSVSMIAASTGPATECLLIPFRRLEGQAGELVGFYPVLRNRWSRNTKNAVGIPAATIRSRAGAAALGKVGLGRSRPY